MKRILGAALLTTLASLHAGAQATTETKLPELPAAAGAQAPQPVLPAPTSTYDPTPEAERIPVTTAPAKQLTPEDMNRIKQDENWLVEGMKKKQEDDAAADSLTKKSAELKNTDISSKKDSATKENTPQAGDMGTFKPVVTDSSLASLNPNAAIAKKKPLSQNSLSQEPVSGISNPLTNSSSALVQPILGPSRQPMNNNVANLNPGVGVTPLPQTGIKKISSNPNFIPDGYGDSWTKQQESPYSPLVQTQMKPPLPQGPVTPRPTFKDLSNTIPDPTQVR